MARRWSVVLFVVVSPALACAGILGLDAGLRREEPVPEASTPPDAGPIEEAGDPATYHAMNDTTRWSSFDLQSLDPGARNYFGGAFDGRYVYFAPYNNGYGSLVARLDTDGTFTDASAWSVFPLTQLATYGAGFFGAVRAKERVFFVPYYREFTTENYAYHGVVAAHRNNASLDASWAFFNMSDLADNPRGDWGAAFDGRYVYFAPSWKGPNNGPHGVVSRYDTEAPFGAGTSWLVFDLEKLPPVNQLKGFAGTIFDGRYVYFIPLIRENSERNGRIARYDTQASFINNGSWTSFDLTTLNANARGFVGGAFDGRYIYLVPSTDTVAGAIVPRFDTQAGTFDAAAWSIFSLSSVSPVARGFNGAAFDGRYVYLIPTSQNLIVRYDITNPFDTPAAWSSFSLTEVDGGGGVAYHGAIFDGKYLYLVPHSGNVLRFDAKEPKGALPVWHPGSFL